MVGVREGLTVVVAHRERAHDVAVLLRDFNAEFDTASPALRILTARFQRLLERDEVLVCVADLNHSVVGCAFLTLWPSPYYETPVAMLEELYVRPALRGQGIGTAIMDVVEAELHGRGVEEIQINVDEMDGGACRFFSPRSILHRPSVGIAAAIHLPFLATSLRLRRRNRQRT